MASGQWVGQLVATACVAAVLAGAGCAPATERPVRGVVQGAERPAPTIGVPPTITINGSPALQPLPSPGASQSPQAVASPSPTPSPNPSPPIVRTIQPAAGAAVPLGAPVRVGAVLVGRGADLGSADLSINGAAVAAQIEKRTPRDWSISVSQTLPAGTHTARVLVIDDTGARGGFTWRFTVGAAAASLEPTTSAGQGEAAPKPASAETPEPAEATATPAPEPTAEPKPTSPPPPTTPPTPEPTPEPRPTLAFPTLAAVPKSGPPAPNPKPSGRQ